MMFGLNSGWSQTQGFVYDGQAFYQLRYVPHQPPMSPFKKQNADPFFNDII